MKISKEKLKKLKSRASHGARSAAAGGKSTIYEGAAGAVSAYAGALLDSKVEFAGSRPWVKGAALVAGGHFLKKKKSMATVGAALCGAGGYALGLYFRNRQASAAAAPAAAPVAAPSQTSGIYGYPGNDDERDTGAVFTSNALKRAA